jgi:hypothetical protein
MKFSIANIFLWAAMAIFAGNLRAETGCEAWLRYNLALANLYGFGRLAWIDYLEVEPARIQN